MSAYGGPLTSDAEREDREWTGQRDHNADGDTWSTQPSEPCRRQAPPMAPSQAGRGPCPGRIDPTTGLCDWCSKPPRTVQR